MSLRFAWVTDIPTPYRNHQFERMVEVFPRYGIEFKVLFMAWAERRRSWNFAREDLRYPWALYDNPFGALERRAIHVNPSLLVELRRGAIDVAMIGGWASPTHLLAPLLLPRHVVKILGCESHLGSVRRKARIANLVKSSAVRRYDGFLVPGARSLELLTTLDPGAVSKPWVKLPNVIDASLFRDRVEKLRAARKSLRARLGVDPERQLWVTCARLAPEKGLQDFLPLLAGVKGVELIVAGEGPLRETLQGQIAQQRLPVRLIGQQRVEDVLELYAAADLFVLPSLADPSPLCAVEAAAAGLPLLLSNRAGNCDDLLVDGVNGWIFDADAGDARRELVAAIASRSPEELRAMGVHSLERYESGFDSGRCIEGLARFIVRVGSTQLRRGSEEVASGLSSRRA